MARVAQKSFRDGIITRRARDQPLGHQNANNNTQIAAAQRVTNQASESQTSTSSRFMVGFCQMMLVWPRSAVLRGAQCLPNRRIQVLLLRANNLGFGAENLRQRISAIMNRGLHGPAPCRSVIVVPSAAPFEPVASHLPSFCR